MMKHYIGEIKINSFGTPMKIVELKGNNRAIIEFQDEHRFRKETTLTNFNKRSVLNPYDKTVYGVGYVGYGKYKSSSHKRSTKIYDAWNSMMRRCYCEKNMYDKKSYYGICHVCDEWKNFQNYAEWYEENYYTVGGNRMHVDKDIIMQGNKTYGPNNCIIVPQCINVLFVNKLKDDGLPVGIEKMDNGMYRTSYDRHEIGETKLLKDAIYMRELKRKEKIKRVADSIRNELPDKIYRILVEWEPIY